MFWGQALIEFRRTNKARACAVGERDCKFYNAAGGIRKNFQKGDAGAEFHVLNRTPTAYEETDSRQSGKLEIGDSGESDSEPRSPNPKTYQAMTRISSGNASIQLSPGALGRLTYLAQFG